MLVYPDRPLLSNGQAHDKFGNSQNAGLESATVLLEALYFGNDSHLGAPKALRITCIGIEF